MPALDRYDHHITGFHIFTINEVGRTEAWQHGLLARLSQSDDDREPSFASI